VVTFCGCIESKLDGCLFSFGNLWEGVVAVQMMDEEIKNGEKDLKAATGSNEKIYENFYKDQGDQIGDVSPFGHLCTTANLIRHLGYFLIEGAH
jgi:hypothetical protein